MKIVHSTQIDTSRGNKTKVPFVLYVSEEDNRIIEEDFLLLDILEADGLSNVNVQQALAIAKVDKINEYTGKDIEAIFIERDKQSRYNQYLSTWAHQDRPIRLTVDEAKLMPDELLFGLGYKLRLRGVPMEPNIDLTKVTAYLEYILPEDEHALVYYVNHITREDLTSYENFV